VVPSGDKFGIGGCVDRSYSSYGKRVGAYFIDLALNVIPSLVSLGIALVLLFEDATRPLGVILIVAAVFWPWVFGLYNLVIRQGRTGQSIGKSKLRIKIVRGDSSSIPGGGWMFLRYFLTWLLGAISGGIFTLVDYLFPAFDSQRRRVIDMMLQTFVVDATTEALPPPPPIGTPAFDTDPFR
jgi:uncharacterized RDD family membrane protein YckC